MEPTKFKKQQRVWAKDQINREWLGEVRAVWRRLNDVIYRVYVYNLDKSFQIKESDLRESDEIFEGDEWLAQVQKEEERVGA